MPAWNACRKDQIIENSAGYFEWMRKEVMKPDFLTDNFLSTERRIPVTELGTNACSPLATNGLRGDIWDNFTSTTYKELPAVGKFTVHNPKTGEPWEYEMPGQGRGYTRPASLISLWSTAPFLLNNAVGTFYGEAERRGADGVIQRLDPADAVARETPKRLGPGDKVPGYIQRTTADSYLRVAWGYLPGLFSKFMDVLSGWFPWLFGKTGLEIGPIPTGTPVGLLASVPFVSERHAAPEDGRPIRKTVGLGKKAGRDLKALPNNATAGRKSGGVRGPRRSAAGAQQVSRLRRQPRALLRHQSERRRQVGADRIFENILRKIASR